MKEGHEEREEAWERKRKVEMKERVAVGTIMYIDATTADQQRIQRRSSFCLSWKLILLSFHMIELIALPVILLIVIVTSPRPPSSPLRPLK